MLKLLIAEDEILERKALRFIIEKNLNDKITIVGEASDGSNALNLAKKTSPEIILMDIKMPEMNGLECQKIISKILPNSKTIILTAYDNFKFAQNAIKVHAFDYLLKPAEPRELVDSINNVIDYINNKSKKDIIEDKFHIKNNDIIDKAINFININYNKDINLDMVSSHVHLNPQYFSRYFKSKVGINFVDYLSKVRIDNAKKLLINSNENIKWISFKVGYIAPAYFSKVFLKLEGVSPNTFRFYNKNDII
ncbi:response regulator [Clostridium cochlearium]|uniref:response regulator transcription factor n=1 Tax=Clostridium cochlearium TaxID=1494 RepID=UPI001EDDC736|nr:response regulator [Clostridium cochlearium]MBV1818977.1 response regulator [Bacteroidales bacterium MSK.15.36]MCG4572125.1 response regulator [Clostridium cochlearium]